MRRGVAELFPWDGEEAECRGGLRGSRIRPWTQTVVTGGPLRANAGAGNCGQQSDGGFVRGTWSSGGADRRAEHRLGAAPLVAALAMANVALEIAAIAAAVGSSVAAESHRRDVTHTASPQVLVRVLGVPRPHSPSYSASLEGVDMARHRSSVCTASPRRRPSRRLMRLKQGAVAIR